MKRLKYGLVAALGAWLSGWVVSLPFEFSQAWRYVDGNVRELPVSLAKGMVVWAGFSLFMATAGFLMLGLPAILLIPPLWFVRWRRILIPAAPLVALVAIDKRMGLLHRYYFLHPKPVEIFFFTAPTFFVMTFALTVVWLYAALAGRRGHSVTGGPT
ncbi:MAG: hypothetical protein WA510_04925 [Acidobacteriaceae bacterium]